MTNPSGKRHGLDACTNDRGIIAALAMDQRGSLRRALASASGKPSGDVPDADLVAFKEQVSRILTPHATAILLDPTYGMPAAKARADGAGLILAYEKSGYDASDDARLPTLLPDASAASLEAGGADALKVLVYHDPAGPHDVNERKREFVRRLGDECREADVALFLEPVTYAPGLDGAALDDDKPERVRATVAEWTRPEYGVDVLKVEVPVPAAWLEAQALTSSEHRKRVLDAFRSVGEAATRPLVFLSAGVDMPLFVRSLELAAEAGIAFNGVLCGRATWKGGLAAYARGGADALEAWLSGEGSANIERLNAALEGTAQPL